MAWQVQMTDEYGSTSILTTVPEPDSAVDFIRDVVSDENVNNALTVTDKERNWGHYFPQFFEKDKLSMKQLYAGRNNKGEHCFIRLGAKDDMTELHTLESAKGQLQCFLGKLDREDWYAQDHRGNILNDLNGNDFFQKTFYFIRKV